MALLSKKKTESCSTGCLVTKWALCLLLLVVTLAALIGVYETHVIIGTDPARFAVQFGSTSGSLAILAFTVASVSFMKHMICCMSPCEVCSR
ncbi:MAG: hypothetical protein KBA40_00125 [Candidatus Peribacteraceae bacterium]|nr:hypothetical protein [Candidatus Peribacteraceae bacterium]MBP9850304.1 hypothetical protein [Candidatus Peribacteraceae bacterium]